MTAKILPFTGWSGGPTGGDGGGNMEISERVTRLEERLLNKDEFRTYMDGHRGDVAQEFAALRAEISPMKTDVSSIKNELPHKSSHADIANAVNSLTWKMIGGIAFLSGVMALFKFLH